MTARPCRRLTRAALLLFAVAAGCRTVTPATGVRVRDAETGAAVPGAAVRVSNFNAPPGYRPPDAAATAGADGVAWVRVPADAGGAIAEVSAAGYLPAVAPLRDADTSARGGADPGIHAVAEVFAGPRPSVVLVLPKDYRGPVRVGIDPRDDLPAEPGKREFRAEVSAADGHAEVEGPAVLRLLTVADIRAVRPDGTVVLRDGHDLDVSFRWVRSRTGTEDFIVGTKIEWTALYRQYAREEQPPSGSGGGGRGGGRRGHGGSGMGR